MKLEILRAALMETESRPDKHPICVIPHYFGLSGQFGDGCQCCPFIAGQRCILQWIMDDSKDTRELLRHIKEAGSQPELTPFFESGYSTLNRLGKQNLDKIYSRLQERYKNREDPQPKTKGRFEDLDVVSANEIMEDR